MATLASAFLVVGQPAQAASPDHDTLVSQTPASNTPDVLDEEVNAIYDAGAKILAGGLFTRVRNRGEDEEIGRQFLFAFDQATGTVDDAFAPTVDGEVTEIIGGPTTGTVFVSGRFKKVNGVNRPKLALLNVADGSLVKAFKPLVFDGVVNSIALVNGHLLVGGNFTQAGNGANEVLRNGLASLDPATGDIDDYLTVSLEGHHNYDGTANTAQSGVGPNRIAVSSDGEQAVVIGNFKTANAVVHDQIVKLDLGADSATIANWNTDRYGAACYAKGFDSYVRDVAFSPDGKFFVVATTGHMFTGALCDAAARFDAANSGAGQQPTWVEYTGGDTVLSVAVSETAVYIGGHFRWLNNSFATASARPGAIGRASIAALDPANGLPLDWNPGRNPRGYGITRLYLTPDGLWLGHDTKWMGNYSQRRERIAFFPLEGGAARPSRQVGSLPGKVYRFGANPPAVAIYRVNFGGPAIVATDGGPDWAADTAEAPRTDHISGLTAVSGKPTIENVSSAFPPPTPRTIFDSERSANASRQYILIRTSAAPAGMTIHVRLYFANRCSCAVGARKMDLLINGVRRAAAYDTTADVGNEVGTMKVYGLTSTGTTEIRLNKVSTLYPNLAGIEILKVPAPSWTGAENKAWAQSYDGASAVGAKTDLTADATPWYAGRGGFWVGGDLFYAIHTRFYRRTFDGTAFGPATLVEPYRDSYWDSVVTGGNGPEGQTYAGAPSNFYWEMPGVSAMFYARGRLYYTIAGEAPLYYRWFTPDTGAVGADRFTAATTGFADSDGLFLSDGKLYMVSRGTGKLSTVAFSDGAPSGAATVVSDADWRGKLVFIGP